MKIADGIEALELTMHVAGNQMTIHPTLIWDADTAILIDTGMPGQLDNIRKAMKEAGVPLGKLDKVILTHQDIDHIGGLPEILETSDHKIEVIAHEIDKPYIEGVKPLIKMGSVPGTPPMAHVDTMVQDGEELPYCGGIVVIFTPGHTPGHISLYHKQSKTLITGDALVAENGKPIGLNERATPDMETAVQSLKKFVPYDIDTVICYHGGVCTGDVNEQLERLARG